LSGGIQKQVNQNTILKLGIKDHSIRGVDCICVWKKDKNNSLRKRKKAKESQTSLNRSKKTRRKKRSGNKNYEKGRRFEYRIVNYYRDRGYWAKRSWASKGPFDVMAIKSAENELPNNIGILHKVSKVLLLQCKNLAVEQKLSQYEADNLRAIAQTMNATPLHAYNNKKHQIVIEEIT
jgi:hypothetical protein